MVTNALVIDEGALNVIGNALVQDEWFTEFGLPGNAQGLKRIQIGGVVYLLSRRANESSCLLVINVGSKGVLGCASSPRHAFDRILHVALSQFDRNITIPVQWRPFHQDSLLSVYAQPPSKGARQRLYFDRSPEGSRNLYAFACTDETEDFDDVGVALPAYRNSVNHYLDAVLAESPSQPVAGAGAFGIILSQPVGANMIGAGSLSEWYETKLTREQRRFVDREHDAPVRLRGSAGTGKTLSMAVKCLRDTYRFEDEGGPARVAFITHSHSLAHTVLPGMFYALDPSFRWQDLETTTLTLGSLYELAQDILQYDRKELKPLSTDGREGRELQRLLIDDAIEAQLKNTKFRLRDFEACSDRFKSRFLEKAQRPALIADLMNEFACVIDANNIQKGTPLAEKYISNKREAWQMPLNSEGERRAVLDIHDTYARMLQQQDYLSMDQMIADFNRYLLTHEWRQLRDRQGFDIIFVDEFHYFNRAERMTLHNLFKSQSGSEGRLPLFMAYDLKQSPTDALLPEKDETAAKMFKNVGAGVPELVELTEIFRSTPQITTFLKDLDASFPALDLEDEWGTYCDSSAVPDGAVPELRNYDKNLELIDRILADATVQARAIGGRQVAILCLNEDLFDQYRKAGRILGKAVVVPSRDEVAELRYAGKRPIFSMPDYVAGLQFEAVFLIHVDKVDSRDLDGIGPYRRFLSRCYLGASRAASMLVLASSEQQGGPSEVLKTPLRSGSLAKR